MDLFLFWCDLNEADYNTLNLPASHYKLSLSSTRTHSPKKSPFVAYPWDSSAAAHVQSLCRHMTHVHVLLIQTDGSRVWWMYSCCLSSIYYKHTSVTYLFFYSRSLDSVRPRVAADCSTGLSNVSTLRPNRRKNSIKLSATRSCNLPAPRNVTCMSARAPLLVSTGVSSSYATENTSYV